MDEGVDQGFDDRVVGDVGSCLFLKLKFGV